jgi:membrane-associated phospholipid phosphatase
MVLADRLARLRCVVLWMLLVLMWSLTGCGTLDNGRGWGQDAFTSMRPRTVAQAAKRALLDVGTLAPAAGAIVFAASGLDDRVADWASEHTPLFGSITGAQRASDVLNITLHVETLATALATPSGPEPQEWMYAKLKGLGGELLAFGVTLGMTDLLKTTTDRTRPDQSNARSFPSGHASGAFAAATLSNRNLEALRLPTWAEQAGTVGTLTLASAAAWARVEGGRHFPSDVLAGAAIGHFFSAFIHDAVLGLPDTLNLNVAFFPEHTGGMVELSFGF